MIGQVGSIPSPLYSIVLIRGVVIYKTTPVRVTLAVSGVCGEFTLETD